MLRVKELRAGYNTTEIVHGVSFEVDDGQFACIIGANGCGKTTLLKNLLGLIKPFSGAVEMNGADVLSMDEKELARHFAYIPQAHTPPFPFAVRDVVLMGRTPHMGRLAVVSPNDRRIAFSALVQLGIENLADETYTDLSGGQRQLVLIARALTQQPELLIMDEPTAALDALAEAEIYENFSTLVQGKTAIYISHRLASTIFCDKIALFDKDGVKEYGTHEELMAKKGMYYEMFVVQGKYYQEEVADAS